MHFDSAPYRQAPPSRELCMPLRGGRNQYGTYGSSGVVYFVASSEGRTKEQLRIDLFVRFCFSIRNLKPPDRVIAWQLAILITSHLHLIIDMY